MAKIISVIENYLHEMRGKNTGDDVHEVASSTVETKIPHRHRAVARSQIQNITVAASISVISGKLYISKCNFDIRKING